MLVAVFGATGFVGGSVMQALAGHEVKPMRAPRVETHARTLASVLAEASGHAALADLEAELRGVHVVVNAAGDPDASSLDGNCLFGANAVLPGMLLTAAMRAGVGRFVHISSAVVQNDKPTLDSTEIMSPFSPYSGSKVLGEQVVRELSRGTTQVVRYRPPSVHAPGRRVTKRIARIATSPLASVASPGDQPSPQALLPNVGSAAAFLATSSEVPPAVVHHPSEGVTVSSLMQDLSGGRRPTRIPRAGARFAVSLARTVGRVHGPTAANARRAEILWFGQRQGRSWLEEAGWQPAVSGSGWRDLTSS